MNLLKNLLRRACPHEFSWPRIDDDGRHYQICLACGTAFEYDWKKMRRTGKLMTATVQHAVAGAYSHDVHGYLSSK
ncbi:MAG: hypothetical protein WAM79_13340 [Candidatus Sulfotelmatobacter sp.]